MYALEPQSAVAMCNETVSRQHQSLAAAVADNLKLQGEVRSRMYLACLCRQLGSFA